eukprot:TRINITY_DN67096_c1_g1_i2.p1 TRINITY_DN67096_c1_g1~~TRINITY_DN67096_c1_g1_i2.p1  ORF type:complete len:923 (-),score=466.19 TRINITY_DN67096_c1_g1_i2:44-2773(-)
MRDWDDLLSFASNPAIHNLSNPSGTSFFFGKDFSASNKRTRFMRTMFWMGRPLEGYRNEDDRSKDQNWLSDKWASKVHEEILTDARADDEHFDVLYGGGAGLINDLIVDLIMSDGAMAGLAAVSVFFYISFHTQSWFLSSLGMFHILMSFPIAYFINRFIFQIIYVDTISTFLIFIIMGIGADDIFVFYDAWRQSYSQEPQIANSEVNRLSYTLRRAASAMLTTSATTTGAFAASAVTELMPTRGFGILASMMVLVNYSLVITYFPGVVLLHDRYIKHKWCNWRFCCQPRRLVSESTVEKDGEAAPPQQRDVDNGADVEKGRESSRGPPSRGPSLHRQDSFAADEASKLDAPIPDDDVHARYGPVTETAAPITRQNPLGIKFDAYGRVETFLYKRFAPFVLKWRGVVLMVAFAILAMMIGFASQLEPETEPPKWLRGSHFFQRWDDAMFNEFPTSTDDDLMIAVLVWGIKGIDRGDHSMFDFGTADCHGGACGRAVYDSAFDPSTTDAQNSLVKACEDAAAQVSCVRLNQINSCFMKDFKEYRLSKSQTFPVAQNDFYTAINEYVALPEVQNKYIATKAVYLEDGKFKWISADFKINFLWGRLYSGEDVNPCYDSWINFMNAYNKGAPQGVNNMFVTSSPQSAVFVGAFTSDAFVNSAIVGVGVALSIALVILFISTHNWVAALTAFFWVCSVVVSVLGITWLAGWKIGIIEGINATMVVGFSVDFCVHFAHNWTESELATRVHRVYGTFLEMGVSILAGGITTFIASIFLCLTSLLFFFKFGIFVMATISFSLLTAFFPSMASLSWWGPEYDYGDLKIIYRHVCAKVRPITDDEEEEQRKGKGGAVRESDTSNDIQASSHGPSSIALVEQKQNNGTGTKPPMKFSEMKQKVSAAATGEANGEADGNNN